MLSSRLTDFFRNRNLCHPVLTYSCNRSFIVHWSVMATVPIFLNLLVSIVSLVYPPAELQDVLFRHDKIDSEWFR